jgi:hypothetical protein
MSRTVLMSILADTHVWLSNPETDQLYQELLAHFCLVGSIDHCQVPESAWKDPYNKQEIENFINAWIRRKQRKKEEAIPGVV